MSDAVSQAIIGGAVAIVVALINKQWAPRKADDAIEEGELLAPKRLPLVRTGAFVWVIAPLGGGLIALVIYLAGFNGIRAVAGAGPVPLKAPVAIVSSFYPSGFMGDIQQIELNSQWADKCHTGQTCVRVKYTPGGMTWAGVYWQSPLGNWGDLPGRRIEGARKLVFWARGELGGELVSFRSGGIQGNGKKYHDSLDLTMGPVKLTTHWQEFEFDLAGADMSSVIGAFSWNVARDGNPQGATFYLDGMSFD